MSGDARAFSRKKEGESVLKPGKEIRSSCGSACIMGRSEAVTSEDLLLWFVLCLLVIKAELGAPRKSRAFK